MRARRRALGAALATLLVLVAWTRPEWIEDVAPAPGGGRAEPRVGAQGDPDRASHCPLSGVRPRRGALLERPALAVKVENNPVAYPLSGLEKAEVVYEELVEGGVTRFLALYHCTDAAKVGPVRSSRIVDPAIMTPATRILAAAGGNAIVRRALESAGIVLIDEKDAGSAMRRIGRPGVAVEHTLYGSTKALRSLGNKRHSRPPPSSLFEFGSPRSKGRRISQAVVRFSAATSVTYVWSHGRWKRFDNGRPLTADAGGQIAADNVIIERHKINLSKRLVDSAGNPSIEVADEAGSGRAVLLRGGRAVQGRWVRKRAKDPVRFEDASGDPFVLGRGTTWIELLPDRRGQIKGSLSLRSG